MSYLNERIVLESALKDDFIDLNVEIPFLFENESQDRPLPTGAYIAVFVIPGFGDFASLGPKPLIRKPGIFQLNIYIPAGAGVKPIDIIADRLNDIFENKQFQVGVDGVLRMRTSRLRPIGVRDGRYYAVWTCPYHFDYPSNI